MKLCTAAAALDTLGLAYRFHTDVLVSDDVQDGPVQGDLHLKSYSDPTTLEADYERLADQLAGAGILRVTGDLVADDTYFDNVAAYRFQCWLPRPLTAEPEAPVGRASGSHMRRWGSADDVFRGFT